jgi:hypothetical protein
LIGTQRKAAQQRRCSGAVRSALDHRSVFDRGCVRAGHRTLVQNLFARQSRFHLIKLPETIALHAYATTIQN